MAVDLRRQIFDLRQAGASERGIAKQLGLSSSKVHRELAKRAPEVRAERAEQQQPFDDGLAPMVDFGLPPLPAGAAVDPILAEERAMMEREQLQLRRVQLRAQRLEAERRAQLLEHPDAAGGGNGLVAVILQALDRQREDTRSLLQQLASRQVAPPAQPPPSLTEQLAGFRQMADTVASFAPAKAPSSASDLEFVVAKERLQLESQDLAARRDAELNERRERMQSEVKRNDAVATAIEQFAPVAAKALELYFEERKTAPAPPPQLPPASNGNAAAAARPVVLQEPETEGQCPSCQTPLAIVGGLDEKCPKCGSTLAVVEGRIRVRMPNGGLWPPLPD